MEEFMVFLKKEEGTAAMELGLFAALIAGAIMVVVSALGQVIGSTFETISNSMSDAS